MATITYANNMQDGYVTIAHHILSAGIHASPREQDTREIMNYTLVLSNPTKCWASGVGRALNPKIAIAEALQLIGGFTDPEKMIKISPAFKQFTNDRGWFHAPYGPRIRHQLDHVLQKLSSDPDTRQAVVTIWDPIRDNFPGERDYPCTVNLQFMIRVEELHMTTTMRSNDVNWGLPYDVFQFCQLQCTLAHILGVDIGDYTHQVGSMHIYERDVESLEKLAHPTVFNQMRYDGVTAEQMMSARVIARRLFDGEGGALTENEKWMKLHMMELIDDEN